MSLAPGEIPNIDEDIENGTGIFGSYAEASGKAFIRPPNAEPGGIGVGPDSFSRH
jgi:hypothetical protein